MKAVYLIQPWFLILLPPFNPTMVFTFLLLILLPTLMESRSLREDGDVFLGTFLRARDNQNIINLTRSTQTDISQPSFFQRSENLEPSYNQRSGNLEPSSNQRSGNLEPSSNQRSGNPEPSSNQSSGNLEPNSKQRSAGSLEPSSNQRSGNLEPSSNQRSGNLEPSSNRRSGNPESSSKQSSGNLEPNSNQRSGNLEPNSKKRSGSLELSSNQRSGNPDYFFKKVQEILNQGSAENPETGRASSETSFSSEDKFSSSLFSPSEERKYLSLTFLFCTTFKYLKKPWINLKKAFWFTL